MNISLMGQIFGLALAAEDTVHMIGDHGIGKSNVVETFAKENGYHLEILMLAQQDVGDLIGNPYEEDGVGYWAKPVWLKRMEDAAKEGKRCVLFLDELARAPIEVRQAALQIVLDRRIHEHRLPVYSGPDAKDFGNKTLVIAADNPSEDYQTDEIDAALEDRFMTYEVEADVDGWLKWARANNIEPIVTDFIAEYPELLHSGNEDEGKGSSPRAWAKLSDSIKCFNLIDDSLYFSVFASKVGTVIGASFDLHFKNYVNIVKVEDVVKFLGDMPIRTKEEQMAAAKKLGELTLPIEAISAAELAEKIKRDVEKGTEGVNEDVLTVYLASLNAEIGASIYKKWKADEKDREFYYAWAKTIDGRWLFRKTTSVVSR